MKRLLAVILGVLALSVIWWMRRDPAPKIDTQPTAAVVSPAAKSKRVVKPVGTVLNQRAPEGSKAPAANPPDSTPCGAQWTNLAGLDRDGMIQVLSSGALQQGQACSEMDKEFAQKSGGLSLDQCRQVFAGNAVFPATDEKAKMDHCLTAMTMMRAAQIDRDYPDDPVSDLPSFVLANKILLHVSEALSSPDIRARVLRLDEELLRREPDLYAGYKVKALVSLINLGPNGPSLNEGPQVEQALKDCRAFDVADKELDELPFFRSALQGRPEEWTAEAQKLLEKEPASSVARYFQAAGAFKSGDRAGAKALLVQAHNATPNDVRINDALAKIDTAAKDAPIFTVTFGVSFDDGQLR